MINHPSKPKIIIILGMHRSGSSLIAQLVAKWGAYMGSEVIDADRHNTNGYCEFKPLVEFHEKLLASTGNSWYSPSEPFDSMALFHKFGDEAKRLVDEMDQYGVTWCWKDPRMVLFLDFWMNIFVDREVVYLISSRDPLKIASSLLVRDDLPTLISVTLWEMSMTIICSIFQFRDNYKIINYEQLIATREAECTSLCQFLNFSCGVPNNHETVIPGMLQTVIKEPAIPKLTAQIPLNTHQKNLYKVFLSDKIPLDFALDTLQLERFRQIFKFHKQQGFQLKHWNFAQLFYDEDQTGFTSDKVITIEGSQNEYRFRFPEPRNVSQLRFDPMNDFSKIRIQSVQILNLGKPVEQKISFSSNAIKVTHPVYLFGTNDPQIFISFENSKKVLLDEVVINLEILGSGPFIIQELLEALHDDYHEHMNSARHEFLKEKETLENTIVYLQDEIIRLKQQTFEIRSSATYKLARIIGSPLRKII